MYSRQLSSEILRLNKTFSVLSLTGPRQSGKTTLCKSLFPDYEYVNLENVVTRNTVAADIEAFLRSRKNGLIIDEAQYLPDVFSYVQVLVDEDKSYRFILTGSSNFLMLQNITQSLAGRVAILKLLPLSIGELGDISKISTDELMFNGFYPGVWGDGNTPADVYGNYYDSYIERDVRQIVNVANMDLFQRFITVCAARVGNEFNAAAISGEVGVDLKTVQHWTSVLKASYTAFTLPPFFRNIGKRLNKTPKIYFYDVGLVCFLLGIETPQQLNTHPLRGAIFENMVVCDMLKNRYNAGKRSNLYFYRDKSQREVDLVQEFGMQLKAYEIKSAQNYATDFVKNLNYFRKLYGDDVISTQVIYDGKMEFEKDNNGLLNFRHVK